MSYLYTSLDISHSICGFRLEDIGPAGDKACNTHLGQHFDQMSL